jgi:thiopeptide-type bacteriocin biosynthesis protein
LEVICRVDESAKETTLIIKPGTMLGGYARFGLRFSQDFQSNLNQQIANCELRHEPEHLHVDLTYVSSAGNIANVIARPKLGQAELSMGLTTGVETNGKNALPASDLHIGILNNRLVLASRQYQQLVSLHLRTRLNSEVGNPLVKLLHDCASQSLGHWSGFHWGTLEELPFTPRIRYKQVVIAPATWRFRGSTWEEFSEFATTWYIPRYIYAFIENTELLLDRDVPDHQELLRAAVTKSSRERVPFLLFEAPSDPVSSAPRFGSTAHATEVAITLFAKSKDPNYTARGLEPWMFTPIARTQFLPGSEWLYFKIHIHHNLIASFMLDFQVALEEVAGWDVWHFVRFHEFGKSQVRIRIRVVDEDGRQTAHVRLTSYLNRDPRVNSFSVETYVPEYHRYGGTDIAEPLEHVYNADSTFTLEALKYGFPHAEAAVLGVAQILETLSRGDRTLIKRVGHTARLREGAKRKESSSHIVTASTMESLHERMRTRGEALQQYSNYLQVSSWETLVFCATRLSHLHLNRMGIPTHSESPFIQGAKRLLLAKEQGGKQS